MRFSPSKSVAKAGGSDDFARTSMFDVLLAEGLESVPGMEPAFVDDREESGLPNVRFFFNGRSESRETDVPLR